jgi:membrane protease YdiL (CAAX protease family)
MFPNLTARRKAVTFYLLALSFSTALALVVPSADGAAFFGMFSPLLAVLLMMFVVTRDGRQRGSWGSLGLHRAGLRYWPVAILLPTVVLAVAYAVAVVAGMATVDLGALAPGNALIGLAVVVILGLGEEIGWRGYMLPLVRVRNPRSGAVIVGFLHGLWHLPLLLLTTYLADIPGDPMVIVPIFLVILTAAGVIYAWLRDRSGSLWPVVLMHQTFNVVNEAVLLAATVAAPMALTYTASETGVVTMLLVVTVAAVITVRSMSVRPTAGASTAGQGETPNGEGSPRRPLRVH